jgi:PAS domain S-box-containing protein
MTALTVLVLGDQQGDTEPLTHQLRQAEFESDCCVVTTESDYIARLNDGIDLILSDCILPQFDTLHALRILQERSLNIPFIVVADSIDENAIECMKQGAADYILKDHLTRLGPAVRQALKKKNLRDEHRYMEHALRDTETNSRLILDHIAAMIWVSDAEGLCTFFNKPWLDFTGRTMQQEIGYGWSENVHPDDLSHCLEIFHAALRRRSKFEMEYRLKRVDGVYRWVIDVGIPQFSSVGDLVGYVGSCMDITDRKETEDALQKSQSRLQALFDNTQDAILLFNDATQFVDANPAGCLLLGYSRDELLGMSALDVTPGMNEEALSEPWRKLISMGSLRGEYIIVRKDGDHRVVEFRAVANIIPGLHLSSLLDITERKQSEATKSQLAAIVESSRDAILSKSLNGIITSWNAGAERLYSYTADESIGQPISMLHPPERHGEDMHILAKIIKGERIESYETIRIRKDGQRINVSLTVSPIRDAGNTIRGASIIARDITDRLRAEAEFRAYVARREALSDVTQTLAEKI